MSPMIPQAQSTLRLLGRNRGLGAPRGLASLGAAVGGYDPGDVFAAAQRRLAMARRPQVNALAAPVAPGAPMAPNMVDPGGGGGPPPADVTPPGGTPGQAPPAGAPDWQWWDPNAGNPFSMYLLPEGVYTNDLPSGANQHMLAGQQVSAINPLWYEWEMEKQGRGPWTGPKFAAEAAGLTREQMLAAKEGYGPGYWGSPGHLEYLKRHGVNIPGLTS